METAGPEILFQQAVEEHMGIFLKTAHGFTTSAADRDDLVQEILISAWQALPSYDAGACKLATFLYRVAHNRALNWQRTRSRYHQKIQRLADCPHLALDAGDTAAREQLLEQLYALIRQLPPLDRTLIMLQLDQLSQREIAEITGLTESNVGVRLHRIKQALSTQSLQAEA
jgi:RNA polymerase sigma-70 factor (ECF subfamily)